ncbi:c-type cytochrome biogenesis protein CcmI [Pseudomonas sp. GX19020]|uniref:c-type cytochrome biogenesis protein CcmI n=1 Tax=Pseudomonas sp. GX19020 TaxID=2942277 RepID=UPI0020185EC8|nr:c-type cytochrome biogenesis protein CcmI [Pseudomonas sp. GX19020]MCL4066803.1 c-type cytochrome biogenesis protein CcmI [Pseudomonas sp. GX19020]
MMDGLGDATGFWMVAAMLAGGIAILLTLSLFFARRTPPEPELARDVSLYRQQLAGIGKDEARGALAGAEAQRLRAEIGRRLLEADRQNRRAVSDAGSPRDLVLAAAVIVIAVAGAVFLYLQLGRPGQPDLPMATRLAEAEARMATRPSQAVYVANLPPIIPAEPEPDMVEPLQKLRETVDPAVTDNLQGLGLRATIEARLGNYADAIRAQRRLIEVRGAEASATDYSFLTLLLVEQASGYVSPEAEAEVVRGLGLDGRAGLDRVADLLLAAAQGFQPRGEDRAVLTALPPVSEATGPLFLFAGELYAQGGRPDRAFALWRPLIEQGPLDGFWVPRLRDQIRAAAWFAGAWDYQLPEAEAAAGDQALRGPGAEDIAAAAGKSEAEISEMAAGMVAGLGARLQSEGGSGAEWAQLIRGLVVLGRMDEARDMLTRARSAWPEEPGESGAAERALIEAAAKAIPAAEVTP